eukprot:TRINITY_DN2265_c0_g2_i1.p1 TRINITY_DN2265_c0_g2~~TRINITY_DN2265_c0_g2_i1.p1  ORF type:complete len:202 (+),score=88.89 TRINITY_DN2265_c0_g2_i1:19-624(+)
MNKLEQVHEILDSIARIFEQGLDENHQLWFLSLLGRVLYFKNDEKNAIKVVELACRFLKELDDPIKPCSFYIGFGVFGLGELAANLLSRQIKNSNEEKIFSTCLQLSINILFKITKYFALWKSQYALLLARQQILKNNTKKAIKLIKEGLAHTSHLHYENSLFLFELALLTNIPEQRAQTASIALTNLTKVGILLRDKRIV